MAQADEQPPTRYYAVAALIRARKKLLGWSLGLFAFYSISLGLIAPWAIKSQLQQLVQKRLQLQLQTRSFTINPYALSLNIQGLQISGQGLAQPLGFEQLYINFQLSSLWRCAWSFKEFHILGLQGQLLRNKDGSTNFSPLMARWNASAPTQTDPPATDDSSPTRLWIQDLQIQLDKFVLDDLTHSTPYHTQLGPVSLSAQALSSLPNATGQQHFELRTPQGLSLGWSGNISLQPLASSGQFQLRGPLIYLAADYLQDQLNFTASPDDFALGFDYALSQRGTLPLAVKLSNINLDLKNLQLQDLKHQPLLQLSQIALRQGQLDWPEQRVNIPQISLGDGEFWLARDNQGQINVAQLLRESEAKPSTPAEPPSKPTLPWQISNQQLALGDWQIHFADQSLPGHPQLTLTNVNAKLNNLSNLPQQLITYTAGLKLDEGQVQSQGQLQLQPLGKFQAQLTAQQLPLQLAQAYVQTLAKIQLKSGSLSFTSHIAGDTAEQLQIAAELNLDNLEVDEQNSARAILAWQQLTLKDISVETQQRNLSLGQITLDKLFADFTIAADGSTSLDRILPDQNPGQAKASASVDSATAGEDPAPWHIQLGRTQINNGGGLFSDNSLPLAFKAQIQQLNGYITGIDSAAAAPATLKLEGQVAPYGQLQINGSLLPLTPALLTQIKLKFRNLNIPEFSPYSIKFAGRKIASGKMDLDLNYNIKNKAMQGSNKLVLKDFTLGQRVEQPGAMDLPLDLAIALLKDSQGKISADLPVSGKLDDPQFNYGKVIGQAFTRMITNLTTAPFKLLGSLLGLGESENLGSIALNLGSAQLAPPEQEKLNKLAQALAARPQLQLQIAGIYQRQLDGQALAQQALLQSLRTQLTDPGAELDSNDKKQLKLLEAMYEAQGLLPRLSDLRHALITTDITSATSAQQKAQQQQLEQSAYFDKLLVSLAAAQPPTQSQLDELGLARAHAIANYLQQEGLSAERIKLLPTKALKAGAKQTLQLKLKLQQMRDNPAEN